MSSYNEVNGVPAAASVQLMSDLARDTFGFDGYFTSDCDAVCEIQAGHHWQPPTAAAPLDQYSPLGVRDRGRGGPGLQLGLPRRVQLREHRADRRGAEDPTETDTFNVGDVDTSVTRLFTARIGPVSSTRRTACRGCGPLASASAAPAG